MSNDPRYPIGKYEPQPFSEEQKNKWLIALAQLPDQLEAAVLNLDEPQLHVPYREGGWTIQQVVHHVADSHINSLCRMKLILTEENPTIRPYEEKEWAELADNELPINVSLTLLHALHRRMHMLMSSVKDEEWNRTYFHPEAKTQNTLWFLLGMYAWHGKHHTAHILSLREKMGW